MAGEDARRCEKGGLFAARRPQRAMPVVRCDIKPAGDLQTRNLIFASEETTADNQFLLVTKAMAFRCKLMTRARARARTPTRETAASRRNDSRRAAALPKCSARLNP